MNCRSYCHKLQDQDRFDRKLKECLQQKKFKQYTASISNVQLGAAGVQSFYKDQMNVQFILELASKKRNIYEEMLMIDEIGLIGLLGGALGLFVGFSFFGYVTPILQGAFNKITDFFQLGNQP